MLGINSFSDLQRHMVHTMVVESKLFAPYEYRATGVWMQLMKHCKQPVEITNNIINRDFLIEHDIVTMTLRHNRVKREMSVMDGIRLIIRNNWELVIV